MQMTYGVPNVLTVGLMKIKNIGIRPLAVRLMKIENFKMSPLQKEYFTVAAQRSQRKMS